MGKKKFYIVDGHALCYRAYYAFIKNPLFNSEGQNISAIFGFARMLFKMIEEEKPDFLAVAFDPPVKSFRFKMYDQYKANREKTPDDLKNQIEEIKNMVAVLDIPVLINNDYEADDILGTVAHQYADNGLEVVMVTGDKDAYQLLNENVKIYANKKGISEYEIVGTTEVEEKLGITCDQVIDYMALVGDTADNIPGILGVGAKTAQKLISEYKTLDNVFKNTAEIKGKLKEKIEAGKESAYLSKELVTIKKDIPLNFELEEAGFTGFDQEKAGGYFLDMEMPSIASEFFSLVDTASSEKNIDDFKLDYQIIKNKTELEKAAALIKKSMFVSVDTETTGVNPIAARMVGISLSIKEKQGWYLPLQSFSLFNEDNIEIEKAEALEIIKEIMEDEKIQKIGQNIKYEINVFAKAGINLKGIHFDTMLASYLLNPNSNRHGMDDMAMDHLNYKTIKYKELVGVGKKAVPITEVPLENISQYAIEDSDITLQLYNILSKEIEKDKELKKLYYEIELPLVNVLAIMERNGVKVDPVYFKKLSKDNEQMLKDVEQKIYKEAGQNFNINSTRELSFILFEKIGLKPVKKTKTGFSTDINVLEALQGRHAIIDSLIAYRTLSKLKNTYIDILPGLALDTTGRIHTSYNQTIAATGRLSSSDPNLQNIPVRDEFGKNIRKGFIPEKGFFIMAADYSQIELRLAAAISGDVNMINAFKEEIDIHKLTAASVYGVDMADVTSEMRRAAKVVNFAIIYGVSPFGLSKQSDVSVQEAAQFIDRYFAAYPQVKKYFESVKEFAREHGYVKTLCGRKRPVPEINVNNAFRRQGAERIAINSPLQGTSADMIKIAMLDIQKEINKRKLQAKMIMQVHDELVFEVPEDEKELLEKLVKEKMENALALDVPIVVDIGWGKNWEEAH